MENAFFNAPILNSPYEYPARHWELNESGQPTQRIIENRRDTRYISPIPRPRKQKSKPGQKALTFGEGAGFSSDGQAYDPTPIIKEIRYQVDAWRKLPSPSDWHVTPETARLLQHWRHHPFAGVRPFFCQIEAAEIAIWLTEVAPDLGQRTKRILSHLVDSNAEANPGLNRLALKLATGAGKTTVMAMLIAWQPLNAARRPGSNLFVIFGEPDIEVQPAPGNQIRLKLDGVDVFHPNTGEIRSDNADGIACWFIDTDYNEESFFVRQAYFLGANDPYKSLKTTLKAEINEEAWATLHSDLSRPFDKPKSGRVAVKVINHLGDEVMKVFRVN